MPGSLPATGYRPGHRGHPDIAGTPTQKSAWQGHRANAGRAPDRRRGRAADDGLCVRRRPPPVPGAARRDAQSGHLYVTLCPGRWMTPHVGSWQRISQSRVIGRLTRVGRGGLQKSPASGCSASDVETGEFAIPFGQPRNWTRPSARLRPRSATPRCTRSPSTPAPESATARTFVTRIDRPMLSAPRWPAPTRLGGWCSPGPACRACRR